MEALITESLTTGICTNVQPIQIGGNAGNASTEHLVLQKTWMKMLEAKGDFDMDTFLDKEGLRDTPPTR